MTRLTQLEWFDRLPPTEDPKEQQRRVSLFAEREEQFDLVEPGLCLYGIKNTVTKEFRYRTAATLEAAVRALGWNISEVRTIPVEIGKVKTPMPVEVKVILKTQTEEKKKKWIDGKEILPKKRGDGPTLKQEMLDVFNTNPGATKEQLLPKIYIILQRRTGSTDEAHLKNRTNLSYYFYKRDLEKKS